MNRTPINGDSVDPAPDPLFSPNTVHNADIFFMNPSPRLKRPSSSRATPSTPPSLSAQLYPAHLQAFARSYVSQPQPQQDPYSQSSLHPAILRRTMTAPPPPLPPPPQVESMYKNLNSVQPNSFMDLEESPVSPASPPPPPPFVSAIPETAAETFADPTVPVTYPTDDDLAVAIALSQSESAKQQLFQDQLDKQEEEDLARALAESMLSTGTDIESHHNPFFFDDQDSATSSKTTLDRDLTYDPLSDTSAQHPPQYPSPSSLPQEPVKSPPSFLEFGRYDKWRIPGLYDGAQANDTAQFERDIAGGKRPVTLAADKTFIMIRDTNDSSMLAHETEGVHRSDPTPSLPIASEQLPSHQPLIEEEPEKVPSRVHQLEGDPPSSPSRSVGTAELTFEIKPQEFKTATNLYDDEALARRLAAEEEELALNVALQLIASSPANPLTSTSPPSSHQPPYYDRLDSASELPYYAEDLSTTPTVASFQSLDTKKRQTLTEVYQDQQSQSVSYPPASPSYVRPPADSQQSIPSLSSSPPNTFSPAPLRQDTMPPLGRVPSQNNLPNQHQTPENTMSSNPSTSASAALNANHFIDTELLLGVSMGFTPPVVSARLVPMEGAVPNIISLPYGRCPPLHIQTSSWRHLLKLLARMSGTKFEPTVQAMAISKGDLKLRTVVQFVKPYSSSQEWRTILWFSIDHPIPPTAPGAHKYLNPHPNLLPWSYTLLPLPPVLQNGTESSTSKTYTVPATDSVPYPTLPINFPNLAMYLQAALDFSRHQKDDSSNGYRKLAKMVQVCYPNSDDGFFDPSERSGVSGLFKRVIGRGHKSNKKGKTNNEETYELVTPFVPDEWG